MFTVQSHLTTNSSIIVSETALQGENSQKNYDDCNRKWQGGTSARIVSREVMKVRKTHTHRSNILELNLNQQIPKIRSKKTRNVQQRSSNNLPEMESKDNNYFWRTKQGELTHRLTMVKQNNPLSVEDFELIYGQLVRYEFEHEIRKCDSILLEILKIASQNGQKIRESFLPIIFKIINENLKDSKVQSRKFCQVGNVFSFSIRNRFNFQSPIYSDYIKFQIIQTAPQIIFDMIKNGQALQGQYLSSLVKRLGYILRIDGNIQLIKQLPLSDPHLFSTNFRILPNILAMASRSDPSLSRKWKKIGYDFRNSYRQFLPEVYASILQSNGRFGHHKEIIQQNLQFLIKIFSQIKDQEIVKYFFGKNGKIEQNHSQETRYSFSDSTNQAVILLYNLCKKGSQLTKGELVYLSEKMNFIGKDQDLNFRNGLIIFCFQSTAYKGEKLPTEVLNALGNALIINKDNHMAKKITLALCFALRNGQKINQPHLVLMNNSFEDGKIHAAYAIGYFLDMDGSIASYQKQIVPKFKTIIIQGKNSQLREALTFTLNKYMEKNGAVQVAGLESEILKTRQIIESFYFAALKKQILSEEALFNLSQIFTNQRKQISWRLDSGLVIQRASENQNQNFSDRVIEGIIKFNFIKQHEINNIIFNFISNAAKGLCGKIIQFENLSKNILHGIKQSATSNNASCALLSITDCYNQAPKAIQKILSNILQQLINIIKDKKIFKEARQAICLALAKVSGYTNIFSKNSLYQLSKFIEESDYQQISKSILTILGYRAKEKQVYCFTPLCWSKIIDLLKSNKKDFRDSARCIIQNYLNSHFYVLEEKTMFYLAQMLKNQQAQFNSSYLLREISQNRKQFASQHLLVDLSNYIDQINDIETVQNICIVFLKFSERDKFCEKVLHNLYNLLENNDLKVMILLSQIMLNNVKFLSILSKDLREKMYYILFEENTSLLVKQNYAKCFQIFSERSLNLIKFMYQDENMMSLFQLKCSSITNSILKIYKNYFQNSQLFNSGFLENLIQNIYRNISNMDTMENSVQALYWAVRNGSMVRNRQVIKLLSNILLTVETKKIRTYSKQIMILNQSILGIKQESIQKILLLQQIGEQLLSDTEITSLDFLTDAVEEKQYLPMTVLQNLEIRFQLKQVDKQKLKILYLIQRITSINQHFSSEFVTKVIQKLKWATGNQAQYLIQIIRNITKYSSGFPEGLMNIIETKIQQGYATVAALEILQKGILRNEEIQHQQYLTEFDLNSDLLQHSQITLRQILQEIKQNEANREVFALIDNGYFDRIIKRINESQNLKQAQWQPSHILDWSSQIKSKLSRSQLLKDDQIVEILRVVKRVVKLHSNSQNQIRTTQLVTILIMLSSTKITIAQVSTGEGKSLIIAVLAVIKALQGYKVDILTSSIVLAQRDAKQNQDFYNYFGLKATNNADVDYNFNGIKKCYRDDIDIIYGDTSNFQFDILRHEYSDLGTRGKRNFLQTVAIVDEVDSMLIDDSSKIAMLSDTMPGMSQLNIIFTSLWQELQRIQSRFVKYKNKIYYQRPSSQYHLEVVEEYGESQKTYSELLKFGENLVQSLNNPDKEFSVYIPDHYLSYVKNQINQWVNSCIQAKYYYVEKHHYLIAKDLRGINRIVPIDYANTGVIQSSTTWGDGLQQFLQIKEGLQLTPETLITNFLSNKGYIDRYGERLYGLTGTIGSSRVKKLLTNIYNVNFVVIPRYIMRNFTQQHSIILKTTQKWQGQIVNNTFKNTDSGRVVMILCETKKQADRISQLLISLCRCRSTNNQIYAYTRDDNGQKGAVQNIFNPGDIIVATNLAGRGTNIKVNEQVEENGGLHVIVTFLPDNLRVQLQAFGRTARQGKKGSAQMILNRQNLNEEFQIYDSIEGIRKKRDQLQKMKLDLFEEKQLKIINLKDRIFTQFCGLLRQLRETYKNWKEDNFKNIQNVSHRSEQIQEIIHNNNIKGIEERWGLFLKSLNFQPNNKILQDFDVFKQTIQNQYRDNCVIQNPFYYVQCGNSLLALADGYIYRIKNFFKVFGNIATLSQIIKKNDQTKQWWSAKRVLYELAAEKYSKAIQISQKFKLCSAYYMRAFTQIELQREGYKKKACQDLIESKRILNNILIPQTMALQLQFYNQPQKKQNTDFLHQITFKIHVFDTLSSSICDSISVIEKSLKYIDISDGKAPFKQKLLKEQALAQLQKSTQSQFALQFHDLTMHNDIITNYQTLQTMQKAFEKYPSLNGVELSFPNLNKEQALNLIPFVKIEEIKETQILQSLASKQIKERGKISKEGNQQDGSNMPQRPGFFQNNSLINAIQKGCSKVSNFLNEKIGKIEKWWIEIQKAKKIPVSILFQKLTFDKVIQILRFDNIDMEIEIKINGQNINLTSTQKAAQELTIRKQILQIDSQSQYCKQNAQYEQSPIKKDNLRQYINNKINQIEISLKFIEIKQQIALNLIKKSKVSDLSLLYEKLDYKKAKLIVRANEDYIRESILIFHELTRQQAQYIINNADRTQQNVCNREKIPIQKLFAHSKHTTNLFQQFESDGFSVINTFYEQKPIKIKSLIVVSLLAIAQIVLGCTAIMAPNFGTALICQGIGDLITVVRGAVNRNFTWKNYIIQKSISLVISMATCGLSNCQQGLSEAKANAQNIGKGIKNMGNSGAKALKKIIVGSVDDALIMEGRNALLGTTTKVTQNLLGGAVKKVTSTAAKYLAFHLAQVGANKAFNLVTDNLLELVIKQFKEKMLQKIRNEIKDICGHQKILSALCVDKFMLKKQIRSNNDERIESIAEDILHKNQMNIFSDLKREIKKFTSRRQKDQDITLTNILQKISSVWKISNTMESFTKLFNRKLDKLSIPSVEELVLWGVSSDRREQLLIQLEKKISPKNSQVSLIEAIKRIKQSSFPFLSNKQADQNIKLIRVSFGETFQKQKQIILTSIIKNLTNKIIQIIELQLIDPFFNASTNKKTTKMTEYNQKSTQKRTKIREQFQLFRKKSQEGVQQALGKQTDATINQKYHFFDIQELQNDRQEQKKVEAGQKMIIQGEMSEEKRSSSFEM